MPTLEDGVLWVTFADADADTLLTQETTGVYTRALRDGQWDGAPLRCVRFVFVDEDAAAYNSDSLAFVRIETWLEGEPRTPYGSAPDFIVREDGIPG